METSPAPITALFAKRQRAIRQRVTAARDLIDAATAIDAELMVLQDEAVRELTRPEARGVVRQGIDAVRVGISGFAEAARLEAWYEEGPQLRRPVSAVPLLILRLLQSLLCLALAVALLQQASPMTLMAFVLVALLIVVELVIVWLDPPQLLRHWLQTLTEEMLPSPLVKGWRWLSGRPVDTPHGTAKARVKVAGDGLVVALGRALAGLERLAVELERRQSPPETEIPRALLEYLQQLSGAVRRADTKRIHDITQQRLDYLLAGLGIDLEDFRPDEDSANPNWEQRPDPAVERWVTLLPLLRYGTVTLPGVALRPPAGEQAP